MGHDLSHKKFSGKNIWKNAAPQRALTKKM